MTLFWNNLWKFEQILKILKILKTFESFKENFNKYFEKVNENWNLFLLLILIAGWGVGCFPFFANFSGFRWRERFLCSSPGDATG